MTLDTARANIGRSVTYHQRGRIEDVGVITSVNNTYVFVRYSNDRGSKATAPDLLELEYPTTTERTTSE